ncbi:MAG TPA: TIR domain-containing protein [Solirubrobacteraceae bacterium]|nr:TIR domain-containing protein [Solirubrobacteraceae bacterium]
MLQVSVPIAHELLGQCVKQGQALVQRATLVGDFSDYESWKSARKQWIDPTVQALAHIFGGPDQAREFTEAVQCPEGVKRWQEQYSADLRCVEEAIELLTTLRGELAFEGAGASQAAAIEQPAQAAIEVQAQPPAPANEPAYGQPGAGDPHPLPERASGNGTLPAEPQRPFAEPGERAGDEPAVGAELAPAPQPVGAELAPHEAAPAELDGGGESYAPAPAQTREVVLAHGRDERWKQAVEHLLRASGPDHEVRVIKRRSSEGEGLSGVLGEAHGSRYAVVLLTADDVGGPRLESEDEPFFSTRAHQQVVFEMGFLVAALSPGRVCVLYEDGVELPYDLDGVSHVRLDLAGTWQPKLLLHLRRAGFDYDMNKLVSV